MNENNNFTKEQKGGIQEDRQNNILTYALVKSSMNPEKK